MRYQHKHRILEPLNTSQEKGQIIHFLTGYGIRDNYLYDIYYGILGLEDTLKRYYLLDADSRFDYFIHGIPGGNLSDEPKVCTADTENVGFLCSGYDNGN